MGATARVSNRIENEREGDLGEGIPRKKKAHSEGNPKRGIKLGLRSRGRGDVSDPWKRQGCIIRGRKEIGFDMTATRGSKPGQSGGKRDNRGNIKPTKKTTQKWCGTEGVTRQDKEKGHGVFEE